MRQLLKKHGRWFWDRIGRDRLDSTAAHVAFFLIISFLPFLVLVLTLMQRIHFSSGMSVIEAALQMLPPAVAQFIADLFPSPLQAGSVLPIAIATAVWSSSIGMVALIKGLDQIYETEDPRNYFGLRAIAIVYVLAFAAVVLITAALLVFGSTIYNYLLDHLPPFFAALLLHFKSLVGFALLFIFFTLMLQFLPGRRIKFVCNLVGAAVGAGGWVLFSYFFSLFVSSFANFSIYGGLATLIMLMYWLFFCLYIMFLGAEVGVWLERSGIREDLRTLFGRQKKGRHMKKHSEKTVETAEKSEEREE